MPPYAGQSYEPQSKIVNKLSAGIDLSQPASQIADNAFSNLLNLQFYKGVLQVDTGLSAYHQPVRGQPQARFEFQTTSGIVEKILITTATAYLDNNTVGQWQYVSDGTINTTLTAATAAGSSQFQIASTTGLATNDFVGIILSDGTQLQTQVSSVVDGTHFDTVASVPVGKTANSGAAVVRAPVLSGNLDFEVQALMWPPTNTMILTNGSDVLQQFDGVSLKPLVGWTQTVAKTIAEFHGFLLVANTTESGTDYPYRIRNSDQGNPNNPSSGLAGFVDLLDTEDPINQLLLLGPWIIIYRENNIMRRSYIGDPLQLFYDEYMVTNFGTFSASSADSVGALHLLIGGKGTFLYDGGYSLKDVGQQIFNYLFGPQGILTTQYQSRIFSFFMEQLNEVWIFVPTGLNTFCDTLLRYSLVNSSWWIRQFAFQFVGFGFCTVSGVARPWDTQNFPWSQDTKIWASRSGTETTVTVNLCDPVNLQVWNYDFLSTTDNGAAIDWTFTTKNFQSPPYRLRLDGLVASGIGSNVQVDVSTDSGRTFQGLGTLNFGLSYSKQNVNIQIVADSFMFRFSGSDPTSKLDWFRLDFFEESKW